MAAAVVVVVVIVVVVGIVVRAGVVDAAALVMGVPNVGVVVVADVGRGVGVGTVADGRGGQNVRGGN